jgi:hypothetical protein
MVWRCPACGELHGNWPDLDALLTGQPFTGPCGYLVDPERGEPCSPGSGNGIFSSRRGWLCGECGQVFED